jgi:hypothetical protein
MLLVLAVAAILSPPALGQDGATTAAPASPAVERPKFTLLRFNEDWSVLANATGEGDFCDPIKYVPLSDDGGIWASFGGHMRTRYEYWNNFAFGGPDDDDDGFLLWRMLAHADVHIGDQVRVFVEGKSAQSTDRDLPGGRRGLDADSLDLEQGFVDVRLPLGEAMLTLRPGRQVFLFGKQRLVSPLPWANTMRRWDGVSGRVVVGSWKIDGFWSQFVPVQKHEFNDPDSDVEFWGAYATGPMCEFADLDLYYLGLDRDMAAFNGTAGDEERHTLGGRLFGKLVDGALDYDAEGAYQFGDLGDDDIDAYMFATEWGWTFGDAWASPRLHVGFDYASGDDEAGGDVETFNPLFPLGHAYFGYMDIVGRQNIMDFHAGLTARPLPKLTAKLNGHIFRRAESGDALYNAGGGVVRPGAGSASKDVGAEINLVLTYAFDVHLKGELGYGHFFPGDFIDDTGASDDVDFVYVQLQYTF